jgi:four helix bundle protein
LSDNWRPETEREVFVIAGEGVRRQGMGRKIEKFQDLEVWKETMKMAGGTYRQFPSSRDCSLRDQVQMAAASLPSNIPMGYERRYSGEFIQFPHIETRSSGQVRTQVHLATALNMPGDDEGRRRLEQTRKTSAMLTMLIKTRRENH